MVQLRYSGGLNNRVAHTSLGGQMSEVEIPNDEFENLFDHINRVEILNGRTEYRCFYVYNDSVNDYLRAKISSINIPVDGRIAFAIDGSEIPQLLITEDTPPIGLAFFELNDWNQFEAAIRGFSSGDRFAIWIRRVSVSSTQMSREIEFIIDGIDNTLTISSPFQSLLNSLGNKRIVTRSTEYLVEESFIGESLLS